MTYPHRLIQGVVGAIFAMEGVEVRNSVFRNNSAELGAGVFVNNVEASFIIDGCVFDGNVAKVWLVYHTCGAIRRTRWNDTALHADAIHVPAFRSRAELRTVTEDVNARTASLQEILAGKGAR